jgi:hypothetical protein
MGMQGKKREIFMSTRNKKQQKECSYRTASNAKLDFVYPTFLCGVNLKTVVNAFVSTGSIHRDVDLQPANNTISREGMETKQIDAGIVIFRYESAQRNSTNGNINRI